MLLELSSWSIWLISLVWLQLVYTPSPVPYAHITTTTTHKTLRGPRGGLILTNDEELAKKINSAIFPGIQGGPLEHVVAAKAVSFKEVLDPAFKEYAANVIKNSKAMADVFLQDTDFRIILEELKTTSS